jgi:GT2 family glycosyltransferase
VKNIDRVAAQRRPPGRAVEEECASSWPAEMDDLGRTRVPSLRDRHAVGNENDDLARELPDESTGERATDPPEPSEGVEKRRTCVEANLHPSNDATCSHEWSVVIPTVVGWPRLREHLPLLMRLIGSTNEVIVVGDQNDPQIPRDLDGRCRSTINARRRGFGPSCNVGAALARGRYVLFLNDDVQLGDGALDALAAVLEDDRVTATGPNVVSVRLGRSESATELSWHHGVLEARQGPVTSRGLVDVPYVCGAALAVRRDAFWAVGGFDERLAPYFWEDVDLSLRLRFAGGRCVVVSDVVVEHRHGATISREPGGRRQRVYERNRLLVSWANLRGRQWLVHLGWLLFRLVVAPFQRRGCAVGWLSAMAAVRRPGGRRACRS